MIILEFVAFLAPSILAHILGNFYIAHIIYFCYFLAHIYGLPYKYKQWKQKSSRGQYV